MATAAYDGIFLAPESIVICPGFPAFDSGGTAPAELAGVRAERIAELAQGPGGSVSEQ
jgi:hypothetical protein